MAAKPRRLATGPVETWGDQRTSSIPWRLVTQGYHASGVALVPLTQLNIKQVCGHLSRDFPKMILAASDAWAGGVRARLNFRCRVRSEEPDGESPCRRPAPPRGRSTLQGEGWRGGLRWPSTASEPFLSHMKWIVPCFPVFRTSGRVQDGALALFAGDDRWKAGSYGSLIARRRCTAAGRRHARRRRE